jgi:ABC-type dipeptide/oligopeptide/nickel transport system permease component
MIRWILRRILWMIPALVGVSLLTFLIAAMVPGDPVYAVVGERADPAVIEAYRSRLGLDRSLPVRYVLYIKTVLSGDLGRSVATGRPVARDLLSKFPNTLLLAAAAMLFAVTFGVILGVVAAFVRDSPLDRAIVVFSTALISLPVFWFGMLLVFVFAYYLRWLPVAGMEHPASVILPGVTLGSRSLGYLVRLTRSTMIEQLSSDYILAVRAKGAGRLLLAKHALLNVSIPIVTFIGLDFGSYLNGSVLTETIFGWNGVGRYAVNGIFRRDYPVIIGCVLFGALLFMAVNVLIDIVYMMLDPKLRHGAS